MHYLGKYKNYKNDKSYLPVCTCSSQQSITIYISHLLLPLERYPASAVFIFCHLINIQQYHFEMKINAIPVIIEICFTVNDNKTFVTTDKMSVVEYNNPTFDPTSIFNILNEIFIFSFIS